MIGFAGWLGLCVYVGGLLDGNRAYGAVRFAGRRFLASRHELSINEQGEA
jgi:hypothetical protein